jgi:hypothetical protein
MWCGGKLEKRYILILKELRMSPWRAGGGAGGGSEYFTRLKKLLHTP